MLLTIYNPPNVCSDGFNRLITLSVKDLIVNVRKQACQKGCIFLKGAKFRMKPVTENIGNLCFTTPEP